MDQWNSTLYDNHHQFVSQYGQGVVELLQAKPHERILDVGCGTGDLAATLTAQGAQIVGIDLSQNMIEAAQQKYPHIDFHVGDATKLHYSNEFDAIFSNATLHWITTPQLAIDCLYRALKSGGRFVAEFGGIGNVAHITTALIDEMKKAGVAYDEAQFPWYFPSIGAYTALLEAAGFHVSFAQHFDRPTKLDGEDGLRNWFTMFSASFFENVDAAQKERIYAAAIERLRPLLVHDNIWYADYKRIRIIAEKK